MLASFSCCTLLACNSPCPLCILRLHSPRPQDLSHPTRHLSPLQSPIPIHSNCIFTLQPSSNEQSHELRLAKNCPPCEIAINQININVHHFAPRGRLYVISLSLFLCQQPAGQGRWTCSICKDSVTHLRTHLKQHLSTAAHRRALEYITHAHRPVTELPDDDRTQSTPLQAPHPPSPVINCNRVFCKSMIASIFM
jgi:hypothetical protein